MTQSVPSPQGRVACFGNFELNRQTGELRKHGIRIKLQQKPFQVLVILLENPGSVITREELQRKLWPAGVFVDFDHSLNTAVKKLRAALGDTAATPRYVATVDRQGYRFVAPVTIEGPANLRSQPGMTGAATASVSSRSGAFRMWWLRPAVALAVMALAVSGMLYYRSVRASKLSGEDTILIADFANSTGETVFDEALKQALTISLRQSPFLNLVPEGQIAPTLMEMTRPAATPVTEDVAQQVCQRVGSKAYVQGAIAALGKEYVIGLKAINCNNGNVLAGEQVTAASKEAVIPQLGKAATTLRRELGESLASVERYAVPLDRATTPSLDALKAYSMAHAVFDSGKYSEAIPLYKRAIELDPQFALACEALGITYSNGSQNEEAAEWMRRAYALRDHASDLEKLLIVTAYYSIVTHETDKRIETLELMRSLYPRYPAVSNNLAQEYVNVGRFDDAVSAAQEALRLHPRLHTAYELLGEGYLGLNRFHDAKAVRHKEIDLKLDYHWDHIDLYNIAFWENDAQAMQRELEWAHGKPYEFFMLEAQATDNAAFGKIALARQQFQTAIESAKRANFSDVAAEVAIERDVTGALLGVTTAFSKQTQDILRGHSNRNVMRWGAFGYAAAGDTAHATTIAEELIKADPQGTFTNKVWVPVIQAEIEVQDGRAAEALATLQSASPYEFGWQTASWSNFVRGQAYRKAGQPAAAAAEFQKIIDHRGICLSDSFAPLLYVLAELERGRACAAMGDKAGANAAYRQFLEFWKNADSDLSRLKEVKTELAHLQTTAR